MARTFMEITHPDDMPLSAALTQALMSGQVNSGGYEKRYVRPDGGVVWADVTVTAIRDEQGQGPPRYFVTQVIDLTQRMHMAASLHERDALLTSLSRNIPGTVLKFTLTPDGDMRLPYASDGIGELYELDPQTLRQNPGLAFERIHPEDRPEAMRLVQAQVAAMQSQGDSGIPQSHEYRLLLPTKGVRHMRAMISVERSPEGNTDLYCYIHDVTERKLYEQAQLQARTAEAANRAKSDFLSRMSHELRTPLNAVIGFAQLLQMDGNQALSNVQSQRVKMIERAGEHLLAMIGDVLDLSRIEAGSLPLSLETLNLGSTVTDALNLVSDSAQKAQIRLTPAPVADAFYVHADRVRLRQVLINLLSNAIKYNTVGGEVRTRLWREGDQILAEVADTGPGLSPEQLTHLFEPFNRLGAENSNIEGTGIGLVIVRHLVELMHGRIDVFSQPGQGTRFVIQLPAAPTPEPPVPPPAWHAAPVAYTLRGKQRVLYAEDNLVNVILVREILAMHGGYELIVAENGTAAIDTARALRPDLILLDMHLGDMTGFDVADALDRDPVTARIPRIGLSADAMPDTVRAAQARGFVAYLTKPLDTEALLQCLDEQTRK
jgi:signal transduction histidine kinase